MREKIKDLGHLEHIECMRHVLVYGYYQIKVQQLWDTIEHDIADLRPYIVKYIDELTAE